MPALHLHFVALLASVLLLQPGATTQEQVVFIGLLSAANEGPEARLLEGARYAIDNSAELSGLEGGTVQLIVEPCTRAKDSGNAVRKLLDAGAVAVIAPLRADIANAVQRAARGKLTCVGFASRPDSTFAILNALFTDHYLATRIALAHDGSREARELAKSMKKGGLHWPTRLTHEFETDIKPKSLRKGLAAQLPDVIVVDAPPLEAADFLTETWKDSAGSRATVILTPRTFGPATLAAEPEATLLLGLSPLARPEANAFCQAYQQSGRVLGYGAAEGFEAMTLLLHAVAEADEVTAAKVRKALTGLQVDGPRGAVDFDAKRGSIAPPLAAWRLDDGEPRPYLPATSTEPGGASANPAAEPDPDFGEPLGTRRTRKFQFEDDSIHVLCTWGSDRDSSIDSDLKTLGLSTSGEHPLIDRIIKDELMARVISISSTLFGRTPEGDPVPGESLNISFSSYLPENLAGKRPPKLKGPRFWPALLAGDHSASGGVAMGDHCIVFTTMLMRTIFAQHALSPPIGPSDQSYLDGSYLYGTAPDRDRRSELIRALINGYAGAIALTLTHEVGHLAGLDHVEGDPHAIMNVRDGAGNDYRNMHFMPGCWADMIKSVGLSESLPRR